MKKIFVMTILLTMMSFGTAMSKGANPPEPPPLPDLPEDACGDNVLRWNVYGAIECVEPEFADSDLYLDAMWASEGYDCPDGRTLIAVGTHYYCQDSDKLPTTPSGGDSLGSSEDVAPGKRIYTVEEAEKVSKTTGNTVKLRYK